MRLKKATRTLVGTAAVVAVTTLAASPAWACNDRDPALQLEGACGAKGLPTWMVHNPNGWGAVPFTWSDDKGGHSQGRLWAPANGSIALPTHASKVIVVAYRPDKPDLPVWQRHGAVGVKHCVAVKPSPTAKKPAPTHTSSPAPTHTSSPAPTHSSSSAPVATAPSGEARPATPVKAQPNFTG